MLSLFNNKMPDHLLVEVQRRYDFLFQGSFLGKLFTDVNTFC